MTIKEQLLLNDTNVLAVLGYLVYHSLKGAAATSELLVMPGNTGDALAYANVITGLISNEIRTALTK